MVKNKEQNQKIKSTAGITMIALVITIIILLILAAISVATLTGENGILTRAQQAKIETEKAAIEEQIRLAILSATTKAMGGNITIQDVLEELDKAGVDYEIEEGEDGTTIIIDGDYVFDLVEKDGDVDEGFQGTVDKPKPRIRIEKTNYEENTIEVKVSTKRNEQGTLEFYIKEEGKGDYEKTETIENAPEEYSYTFEVADKTKTYRIKVVALAKNGETAETEVTVVGIPTLSSSNTTFTYNPTTATNRNVTATITIRNINTADYALQYSIGNPDEESSWKDYTKAITLTQNGSVYVRLKDKKKGQAGKYTKIGEIDNIDRTGPVFEENQPMATATTNSITITGEATDEANEMGTYQYGLGVATTDGTIKWTWEPENGTKDTTYTFENLTQNTDYSIQMKATDSLGNETTSEIIKVTTESVPPLTKDNTTFTYFDVTNEEPLSADKYTKNNIKVKIQTTEMEYTLQYKTQLTGEGNEVADWTAYPEAGIILTRNQEIYVRVVDSKQQVATTYVTEPIDRIDREGPTFTTQATVEAYTTNSITVKGTAEDAKSEIQGYQYAYSTDKTNWTTSDITTNASYSISGLTHDTTYFLKMIAIDTLGNTTDSDILTQKTNEVTGLIATGTNQNVTFTYTPIAGSTGSTTVDGYGASMKIQITTSVTGYTLQYKTELSGNTPDETTVYKTISNGRKYYIKQKSSNKCSFSRWWRKLWRSCYSRS